MDTVKKIIRYIINTLSVAIILISIFVLLTVVLSKSGGVPEFMGYSAFRVTTGSMEPTLPTNTLIVVHHVDPDEVQADDVISFYSSDPSLQGAVNTHRVTQVTTDANGEFIFTTKGDANPVEDRYPVKGSQLIGVMVFASYFLGTITRIVSNPIVFIPLILIPLIIIVIMNFVKTVRVTKRMMLEEELQAREAAIAAMKAEKEKNAEKLEEASPEDAQTEEAPPEDAEPEKRED